MSSAVLKQSTAIIAPDPFASRRHTVQFAAGLSISQLVAQQIANDNLPAKWSARFLRVFVGEVEIPRAWWPRIRLKAGQNVSILSAPRDGKGVGKVFRTLLTVAVIALTAWVGGGGLAAMLGSHFAAGTVGAALAAAGVSLVGGVILTALAPGQNNNAGTASQSYSLQGAQNAPKPYQPMNVVLGRRRVVPPLAASTWTESVGDDVYLRMLLQWHVGPCELSDLRIGETPLEDYEGVEIQHRLKPGDAYPSLYDRIVREEQLQSALTQADGFVQRTTQRKTTTISIDLAWPTGLQKSDSKGTHASTVQVEVNYRAVDSGFWLTAPVGVGGVMTYTETKDQAFRRNIQWNVTEGQYDVRVRRVTADDNSTSVADDVYWVALRSLGAGRPFLLDSGAITALRIKSSSQLNGVLDNLNGVVQMWAPLWDGDAFTGSGPTRNPGEIANWLALGDANARPLTDRVDNAGLGAWTERCTEKGWKCDYIIDSGSTLDQVLQIVAGTGRGFGAMWLDGKMSVALDDVQDTPVQVFSSRNVRGFSGSISFPGELHAVNVQFSDEDNGYQTSVRTVFANGYDINSATLYETIDAVGKTNAAEAYVVGWRYLAGRVLRPEVYEFDTDLAGLCCRIGSRVEVAHFRMSVGISGARVRGLVMDGDDVAGLLIDESVTMDGDKDYAIRAQSGKSVGLLPVVTDAGTTRSISFPEPLAPESAPRVGDHLVFGEAGKETLSAIVIGIGTKPGKDSHIMAIPYAPDLQADGGEIPEWDPHITPRILNGPVIGTHMPTGDKVANESVLQQVLHEVGERAKDQGIQRLLQQFADFTGDQVQTLLDTIQQVSQAVAEVGLGTATDIQEARSFLTSKQNGFEATITSLLQAATGPDSALVTQQATLTAALTGYLGASAVSSAFISTQASVTAVSNTIGGSFDPSNTVATAITSANASITTLNNALSGYLGSGAVNSAISSLSSSITTTQNTIGGSFSPTATVDSAISSANASITNLQNALTGYTGSGAVASAVSSLATNITYTQNTIGGSYSPTSTVATAISSNSAAITSLNSALTGYTGSSAVATAITALNTSVTSVSNTIGGSYNPSNTVATAITANANAITSLTTSVGQYSASGLFRASVSSTLAGADATIAIAAAATSGGSAYTAGMYMNAKTGGGTEILFLANRFIITDGSNSHAPFLFSGGSLYLDSAVIQSLDASVITTGTLNVSHIAANSIDVTKLQVGAASSLDYAAVGSYSGTNSNICSTSFVVQGSGPPLEVSLNIQCTAAPGSGSQTFNFNVAIGTFNFPFTYVVSAGTTKWFTPLCVVPPFVSTVTLGITLSVTYGGGGVGGLGNATMYCRQTLR